MNLINGTYHLCEMREYAFMILREYIIISQEMREKREQRQKYKYLNKVKKNG